MTLSGQAPPPIGRSFGLMALRFSIPGPSPATRVTMGLHRQRGPDVYYEPRHRAYRPATRNLRRSMLSWSLAAMAIATASGGSTGFVLTGAEAAAKPLLGPTPLAPYSTPSEPPSYL